MKATGIVRKVDELGRVVIPKELRDTLGIGIKSPLEIFVDNENIILKRYSPYNACQITGEVSEKNITLADGKITLSPNGAKHLAEELEKFLVK
ncbi:AbrB/MazE/SpoVT family DNA-binding domain-containing protein [Bacillus cereus group sp. BceL296]|jgi:transcriptional pleiotropic regulator of transition state genes|uniref:AbrB family transcriptional regulator n=5 Tax=Bacillus cereus group TaxID=86661 RepID=A0A1C4DNT3_BACCE|nr:MULTISPECIES: AbrB/MazE/SpoVT family DNA-binding domain-containing protein [Bacillus]EJR42947.1 stage V sporulation protein T [Bacillus cereus VD102]OUC00617.1 AbrB/MazE/SpoVT family DNA-binding domain-containing protein [Bacillus thuringiensis serovar canadensis]AJH60265.1 transcriptional regulator, AbrB family domain protein [Bacillus cereus]AJK37451.1 transcriptional regulator, AbrB family domain protein [Bacillus cereus]ARV91181.1 AbrB family transcriptional regulator [Bacillus thuringi